MINLTANPFNLDDKGVKWVNDTLSEMTLEEKIGQLFCVSIVSSDEKHLLQIVRDMKVGGYMFRPMPGDDVQKAHTFMQKESKIPMLLAANLEAGGNGIAIEGTNFAKPLQVAAANADEYGYKLGKIACREGAAVGCNWAFAPIVDVDYNFRNPITNLRTFGDNPETVLSLAKGYLKAAKEENVAVSIKHFPGDGVDERDQHLVTASNTLSTDDWDKSFGKIYQELINDGAETVMVGHISQPAYSRKFRPNIKDEEIMPATLSKELLNDLLRDQLGFNGLIVTDASLMIGFTVAMKRELSVPTSIANGCDMFLFTKDLAEDFGYMMAGYHNGIITDKRLNEAVTRILATKAALDLHTKKENGTLVPGPEALSILSNEEHLKWTKECADESVTLVKDTQNLLPISPEKYKRVYLIVLEDDFSFENVTVKSFKTKLEAEGFDVTVRNRAVTLDFKKMMAGLPPSPDEIELMGELMNGVEHFSKKYDLVLYVANFETASNNTVIRLKWQVPMGMGNDFPWFVKEVPTMFVSLANPYHLLDVPMIKTFINAYTCSEQVIDATFEKMMGRSKFKGKNPVDPFCGKWDTKI